MDKTKSHRHFQKNIWNLTSSWLITTQVYVFPWNCDFNSDTFVNFIYIFTCPFFEHFTKKPRNKKNPLRTNDYKQIHYHLIQRCHDYTQTLRSTYSIIIIALGVIFF